MRQLELDEIVHLKKQHPCGSNEFKIIRTGVDIKAECLGCGHIISMPREKFLKIIKN